MVDVGGVGYDVLIPTLVSYRLPEPGGRTDLYIRTVVREDSITLYGFDRARERDLFDALMTVTGVGPRVALGALSGLEHESLIRAVRDQDLRSLSRLPGVGKKTAERIALELKDKIAALTPVDFVDMSLTGLPAVAQDAISALQNLGYSPVEAQRAVDAALKSLGGEPGFEAVLSEALKTSTKS